MPRYTYCCQECEHTFEIFHMISEKLFDCDACQTKDSLKRIPSSFRLIHKDSSPENISAAGDLVKEYIQETKKDIKKQKEDMMREYES